ncbi:TetR family transcriptional regulator [Saccharopolyspora erythraea D]|nr:TetR family transcriptional regulator [Saccharopolyspora erythraea D]
MLVGMHQTRGPGRPPKLTRDAVVGAAEEIVRRDGVDALTMRSVAVALGASPMSLYRHVGGKDELLVLLLDRAARQIVAPDLPADPRERLTALCTLLHDELVPRPWAVRVLAAGNLVGPSVLWLIEDITASFAACGLDPDAAYDAYRVVWRFVVGELVVRQSARTEPAQSRQVLGEVDASRYPALAAVAHPRTTETFGPGLEALLDGLTRG